MLFLFSAAFAEAYLSPWKHSRTTFKQRRACPVTGDGTFHQRVASTSNTKRKFDFLLFSHSTSEMEEYNQKLAAAERAIAELQEARQKIKATNSAATPIQSQIKRRAIVSRSDAGTLNIEFPPAGLSVNSVFAGTFSIAWFSAVLPATFSGLWWFMLPFWAAGAMVAKQAVVDPFVTSKLSIGQYAWSLKSVIGGGEHGIKWKEHDGATADLRMVYPEVVAYVNNDPQYELKLLYGQKVIHVPIGRNVSEDELQYLVATINGHLIEMQSERAGA